MTTVGMVSFQYTEKYTTAADSKLLLPLSHPRNKDLCYPGVQISCKDLPKIGMLTKSSTVYKLLTIKGLLQPSVPISGGLL